MKLTIKLLTLITFVTLASNVDAQKLKVTSGKLKDLSAHTSYNIEYTYNDLKVGKMTEEDYLKKKTDKIEKDDPGKGAEWVEKWNTNKEGGKFFDKFETLFNEVLSDYNVTASRDNEAATCLMKINVHFIEPGFNVGVTRRPAYVSMIVTIIQDGNEVAVVSMEKAPGQGGGGYDFDAAYRISEGFEKSGKTLGKTLVKEVYK